MEFNIKFCKSCVILELKQLKNPKRMFTLKQGNLTWAWVCIELKYFGSGSENATTVPPQTYIDQLYNYQLFNDS